MKTLFLIGDSIRRGYQAMVTEKLAGQALVLAPEVNCQFAQYTLRHLSDWAGKAGGADEVDLVHWNNGLWDAAHHCGDECLTPLDVYAEFLRRIHKRIRVIFPRAKVIFALSTPVIEEKYPDPFKIFRLNSDIKKYNSVAAQVMKELNVEINDLYAVAAGFTASQYEDATHFTAEGSGLLADAIVKACKPYLSS